MHTGGGAYVYGWIVIASINGKNSYGAFTGFKEKFFILDMNKAFIYNNPLVNAGFSYEYIYDFGYVQ